MDGCKLRLDVSFEEFGDELISLLINSKGGQPGVGAPLRCHRIHLRGREMVDGRGEERQMLSVIDERTLKGKVCLVEPISYNGHKPEETLRRRPLTHSTSLVVCPLKVCFVSFDTSQ